MYIKTDWQTSLPDTKDKPVSVLLWGGFLYTGSNGFVYKLDPTIGSIVKKNSLSGRGNHEVRFALATDGRTLYVGTDGYALALDSDTFTTKWQTSLPDTGDNIVNLVFDQGAFMPAPTASSTSSTRPATSSRRTHCPNAAIARSRSPSPRIRSDCMSAPTDMP